MSEPIYNWLNENETGSHSFWERMIDSEHYVYFSFFGLVVYRVRTNRSDYLCNGRYRDRIISYSITGDEHIYNIKYCHFDYNNVEECEKGVRKNKIEIAQRYFSLMKYFYLSEKTLTPYVKEIIKKIDKYKYYPDDLDNHLIGFKNNRIMMTVSILCDFKAVPFPNRKNIDSVIQYISKRKVISSHREYLYQVLTKRYHAENLVKQLEEGVEIFLNLKH